MCNQSSNYEAERIKRLGEQDFWSAVDVTFAQWKALRPVCGDYQCPKCKQHYDPTYGSCPYCRSFVGAPADWPNESEVVVIEAKHRQPLGRVSWNTGPVLFDTLQHEQFGATCPRCGALLYEDGYCPKCRK